VRGGKGGGGGGGGGVGAIRWDGGRDGGREFGTPSLPWQRPEIGAGWGGGREGRWEGGERMYHQYQQRPDYNIMGERGGMRDGAGREGGKEGKRE